LAKYLKVSQQSVQTPTLTSHDSWQSVGAQATSDDSLGAAAANKHVKRPPTLDSYSHD